MTALLQKDIPYLERCLVLAQEALEAGDKPFGSILVDKDGHILAEAKNRVNTFHPLAHPEYELAYWAAENLKPEQCSTSIIYTSGEHCPMCSGAQAWSGIGAIVYLSSGQQLMQWLEEFGFDNHKINLLPVNKIIKNIIVRGPGKGEMLEQIKKMHRKANK